VANLGAFGLSIVYFQDLIIVFLKKVMVLGESYAQPFQALCIVG